MPPALAAALRHVAQVAADLRDPWWIIGSAAVTLHAAEAGGVVDVDLLTSAPDAERLLAAPGAVRDAAAPRDRFRSVYGRLPSPGVPIEVMGGLEHRGPDGWRAIRPASRISVSVGDAVVYLPDRAELVAILRRFGRAKDLARASILC